MHLHLPHIRCVALLLVALMAFATSVQAQRLDASFGTAGRLSLGFDGIGGNWQDQAVVACGHGDRLLVSGFASGGWRIVSARLTENGALDPTFSDDGKESFNPVRLLRVGAAPPVGACLADGSPVLAYATAMGPNESEIAVVKLDRATGLPDPAFGVSGYLHLNMAGSGSDEWPRGLSLVDGELLLGIELLRADGQFGAVARISLQGSLIAQRVLDRPDDPLLGQVTTVARWGNGWMLAGARSTRDPDFRGLQLATLSADFSTASGAFVTGRQFNVVGRGRLMAPGVLAVPALPEAGADPAFPLLVLIRQEVPGDSPILTSWLAFDLPGPQPIGGALTTAYGFAETPEVVPLPDGRVALTGTLGGRGAGDDGRGFFVAVARLGANAAQDRVDSSFGNRGWWQSAASASACARPDFAVARTTLWSGRLTLVGRVLAQPCGNQPGFDYWVARLASQPLFADGFE